MLKSGSTSLTSKSYASQSGQSFKQIYSIYTDLYRNLQIFTDLPTDCAMTQLTYVIMTYVDSTPAKTTQRTLNTPGESVKTRRKPLSDNKLFLQIAKQLTTWNRRNGVIRRNRPNIGSRGSRQALARRGIFCYCIALWGKSLSKSGGDCGDIQGL